MKYFLKFEALPVKRKLQIYGAVIIVSAIFGSVVG